MKKNGFGIVAMLALICVFAICLCISAFFYQRISKRNSGIVIEEPHVQRKDYKPSTMNSMYDYSILEKRLSEAAKKYVADNNLDKSLSLIIPAKDLSSKYLADFNDLADEKKSCSGYIIVKENKFTPYIWCKGSYATEGYDVNLE